MKGGGGGGRDWGVVLRTLYLPFSNLRYISGAKCCRGLKTAAKENEIGNN